MFRASPASGIAWVTGASSGVGRAVALELVRTGYRVAATSIDPPGLAALVAEAPVGTIASYPGDITQAEAMADLIERIETEQGPITLAFLNAGGQFPDPPDTLDAAIFRRTADLNLTGTVNGLSPLLRRMRQRRAGQVAINASSAGYGGLPEAIAYGASKAGLIHLAESLRLTCAPDGVTIQLVSLGFVRTPLTGQNGFAMPFMIAPEQAARRICAGFARGGFEIVVPRRLVWVLKGLNHLPYALYFPCVRAMARATRRG